jgi:hypothetical protein
MRATMERADAIVRMQSCECNTQTSVTVRGRNRPQMLTITLCLTDSKKAAIA